MTRWPVFALALVIVGVAAVAFGVTRSVSRDRAALLHRFSTERFSQVQEAAGEVEADIGDIGEDLRFAAELISSSDSTNDRERELKALLAVVGQYRLATVFDARGQRLISVRDPLAAPDFSPEGFHTAMGESSRRALLRKAGEIETSPPVPADPSGWFRIFATPLLATPNTPLASGALAVLVDTAPYFGKLRLLAAEPDMHLILLGSHGRPTPATFRPLAEAITRLSSSPTSHRTLAQIVGSMRAGEQGTTWIRENEAARLGLGSADLVVAYSPIKVVGAGHWAFATASSTSVLRKQERVVMLRTGLASLAIVLCLLGFAAYVTIALRRSVAIRERLRHADEMAHLHEKTEKILDNIPAGVMALSEDGRITAFNRALRERIARPTRPIDDPDNSAAAHPSPEDGNTEPEPPLEGLDLAAAFPRASATTIERLRSLVTVARTSGRVRSIFGEHLALFGTEGHYSIHAVPLEPRFPDARELLVIDDVSELHSLAAQLLRAEKLATVGILAAGIAHEIGTPLGVVRARAEIMAAKLGTDHTLTPGARVILEQIDRVTRTIRQLLDFARIRPAAVATIALNQLVSTVTELLRFEAERRRVSIQIDIHEGTPLVAADPDQIQQALVNLVLNACDACSTGGTIVVRARGEETPVDATHRFVRIEVQDNGCGIPPELTHQVFDPFFTTKKRGQGTGLGLTIVAQIIRNHGGKIDIDSEPGQGTRVVLLWPSTLATLNTAPNALVANQEGCERLKVQDNAG
ncbi:MAG: ATP-binding protein [Pseudomonadota bacterium]